MKLARPFVLLSFIFLASASQGGSKDESAEIEAYRLARLGYLLESAKNEHPVELPDDKESIEFEDDDNEFDCPAKPESDMDYIQDIAQERVNDDIVLDMDCERVASTVTCSFKYTNNGKDDYYLFKRDTPLEGVINSPYIDVYSNGELLEYKGMIMLRDAPTRKDFVLLKAGKSISASISLTDAFEFPRNTIYTIQYNKPVEYIPRDRMRMSEGVSALRATTVFKSDTILILDAKSLSRPEAVDEQRRIVPGPCDNAQAYGGTITERESILKIHKKVCAILDMDPSQQLKYIRVKLYKKWFGKHHKWYINRVNTTFQYIERGLKMRTNYFIDKYNYCESQEGLIGIVWKTTGTVALCSRFFQIKNVFCNKENKRSMEGAIVNLLSQAYGNTRFITSRPEVCQRFTWLPYFAVSSSGNYEHFYCEAQNPRK